MTTWTGYRENVRADERLDVVKLVRAACLRIWTAAAPRGHTVQDAVRLLQQR